MPSSSIYKLSIRIFPDGFSFAVSESGKALLCSGRDKIGQHELVPALQQDLGQLRLAESGTVEQTVIVHTPVFTMVPATLYRPEDAQTWLRFFQTDIKTYNVLRDDSLLPFGCVNVYAISAAVADFVQQAGAAELRHGLSHLLLDKVLPFRQQGKTGVFVYAAPAGLDIVALDAGKLLLANTFAYATPTDALYHLLNVYEQLHLPANEVACYADIPDNGRELKNLLQQYIELINL